MLTSKQEKEILAFIRDNRNEIDAIAEFMYHNTSNRCNFYYREYTGFCRSIGINPNSKASAIISELIRLYEERAKLKGETFEIKTYQINERIKEMQEE